jgi:hypothetical protein
MDGFYRGIETSLLALSLALGIGAFAASALPRERPALGQTLPAAHPGGEIAVTLPMLSVTADTPVH